MLYLSVPAEDRKWPGGKFELLGILLPETSRSEYPKESALR